jgi:hypothetical protein
MVDPLTVGTPESRIERNLVYASAVSLQEIVTKAVITGLLGIGRPRDPDGRMLTVCHGAGNPL